MPLPAGTRLGAYEVLGPLGAGGMGEVYRARDTRLGRDLALKVLPSDVADSPDRLKRFEREAQAASALNHPNIVTVYDIGTENSVSYIAMELVDGKLLREMVTAGPLPVRKLLGIAAQVADGLARAHAAGIVHRDLKPENVMVTKDGLVKILDFGLAKLERPELETGLPSQAPTVSEGTRPGVVMGTVGYMSPEQASGRPLDFRSDQFSFGSILYEMATGRRAFRGGTAVQTLAAIVQDEPEPVASLAPKTPAPLRWIVERCLAKDPDDRFASTRDMARDLASVRDHLSEAMVLREATAAGHPHRARTLAVWVGLTALILGALAGRLLTAPRSSSPSFQRLTFRRGEVPAARFSPDGQTVLYSFSAGGGPADIYSTRIGSPEFRALGLPGAQLFSVSSSGEMAVALGWRWGGPHVGGGTLARVSLSGGAPRQLVEDAMDADWAPDGKSLAVLRYIGPGRRIEFPLGKVLHETKSLPFIAQPRISPRGDLVAFLELDRPYGVSSVHVMDLAGKRRKLSDGWSSVRGLAWARGGSEVWFAATKSGRAPHALFAATLSGKQRLVARFPAGLALHDISPGGRVLLTQEDVRRHAAGRLFGDTADRDLTWLDITVPNSLSVDGKRLLFSEAGEGSGASPSLWLRSVDGSAPVRLGEGHASSLSPDGKWVAALQIASNGANELKLLPSGPGEIRPVPLPGVRPDTVNWIPDGKRLLVSELEPGGKFRSYLVGLSGEPPRPILPDGVEATAVTPDSKWILGLQEGKAALYPMDGGAPRALPEKSVQSLRRRDVLGWADDDRTIFTAESGLPARIFRLDLQTGQKRLWKEIAPADVAGVRGLDPVLISPDGKSYVYTFLRELSELYLVEGLE